jgi:hypothetical protein
VAAEKGLRMEKDDLQNRIKEMLALKPEIGTIVVMQRTLRDVLAEVGQLQCVEITDYYVSNFAGLDALEQPEPPPCNSCIVCVAKRIRG